MSDYLDRPVYDDIADEARADWLAERPEPDLPDDAGALCGPCMWAEVDNPRNQEWWA